MEGAEYFYRRGPRAEQLRLLECDNAPGLRTPLAGQSEFAMAVCKEANPILLPHRWRSRTQADQKPARYMLCDFLLPGAMSVR
jgi:hypothetical protein